MDKEKYDAEFINKTTSHFEDFLQSKKGEINFASKTKNFPKISQVSTYKKNIETFFPFLKEMNINETFFEDIFCCKKFEKNEFITKIKEMCCESVDSNTILLLYEHYEKILSCHFDINNNKL